MHTDPETERGNERGRDKTEIDKRIGRVRGRIKTEIDKRKGGR